MRYNPKVDCVIVENRVDLKFLTEVEEQIARDICRDNKICTCDKKDGHCASIIAIARRLAKQGYIPPSMQKGNDV